ncbi:type II toxin-antitoxin system VapC family toxin [Specibacter cremeus]|uniref:type II toxin-antitoxin system VapC family toxin n=1 Tax=Specibacter cremeus TaxID=1629051 RepID=UPI000F770A97|nr:type II toxin-antitoxin system VapC family toxin [Specibacter cremeus]
MSLAVINASVLAVFYAADDPRRDAVAPRLSSGDALFALAHVDAEVVSALRGPARHSEVVRAAAPVALRHLAAFPIRRMALAPLLGCMWELRENVTPYDGAHVALAERLGGRLITSDAKLTAASGTRCVFDLIADSTDQPKVLHLRSRRLRRSNSARDRPARNIPAAPASSTALSAWTGAIAPPLSPYDDKC